MMLVGYSTWSMLSSPLGRVKPADGRGDDVGCPLDSVGESTVNLWRGPSSFIVIKTMIEKRSRSEKIRIANMEIPKIINPEFVFIPVKGRRSNLPVDLEEFIDMFPCF
jgi:hypothetical protein